MTAWVPARCRARKKTLRRIVSRKPDMVGFSATTSGFLDGYRLAALVKKKRPGVTVVFGGVHISALGGSLLEQYGDIDYLCLGEGEASMAELADGRDPKEIDGLAWRDGGRARVNGPRDHIRDLDSLPFPAYGKLAGFPRRLQSAPLQLCQGAGGDHDHQPRLPLPVLLLRPVRVQTGVPLQFGRLYLRAHEAPADTVSACATSTFTTISSP